MTLASAATRLSRSLLLVALILLFVPLAPRFATEGLDPSWAIALSDAVGRRLAFGRDIVFTHGPYAAVTVGLFHPATDRLMLGGAATVAIGLWASILLHSPQTRGAWSVIALLLGIFGYNGVSAVPDVLLLAYPLVVVTAWDASLRSAGADTRRWEPWCWRYLTLVPLGMLPLVKGTGFIASVVGTSLVTALCWRSSRLWCWLVPASWLVHVSIFWMIAGQHLADVPRFFTAQHDIIAGYSEAMAVGGRRGDLYAFLCAIVVHLAIVGTSRKVSARDWAVVTSACAVYFLAFKAEFVRHGGRRPLQAALVLIIAAAMTSTMLSDRMRRVNYVVAAGLALSIVTAHEPTATSWLWRDSFDAATRAVVGVTWRLGLDRGLEERHRTALARIRDHHPIPPIDGPVDIYPFDQVYLIANGLTASYRPTLQSYSAYTLRLQELNREHLAGLRTKGGTVLFFIHPIDDRFAAVEDGLSWPILLTQFTPTGTAAEHVVLRPSARTRTWLAVRTTERDANIGDDIPLPKGLGTLWMSFSIQPTMWGVVMQALFKPDVLGLEASFPDGHTERYRLFREAGQSGFLVAPVIRTVDEFVSMYRDPPGESLNARQPQSVRFVVMGRDHGSWRRPLRVRFDEIHLTPTAGAPG